MPFKRYRTYRRRKAFRKPSYKKKAAGFNLFNYNSWPKDSIGMRWPWNTKKVAKTALKVAKNVANVLNVEYKVYDTTATGNLDYGSPTVTHLNPIETGDSGSTRNGASVRFKSLLIDGKITKNPLDTSTATWCKFAIIDVVSMPSTSPPTQAEVYTSTNVYTLRNLENTKNIKVLWSGQYQLNLNTTADKRFIIKVPLNLKTKWNSNFHATIPKEHSLYLMAWAAHYYSDKTPSFGYQSRLRYVDN